MGLNLIAAEKRPSTHMRPVYRVGTECRLNIRVEGLDKSE